MKSSGCQSFIGVTCVWSYQRTNTCRCYGITEMPPDILGGLKKHFSQGLVVFPIFVYRTIRKIMRTYLYSEINKDMQC